ncbi:MAG TPA: hypothetical protein EYP22_03510 [Methanosarcinales archaeon]|nr:hypothetical protein [Methanosarcinales archaeon]
MTGIKVSSIINPTELSEKVEYAIRNIFPNLDFKIEENKIIGIGSLNNLEKLHDLLRKQKILDTARAELLKGVIGNKIKFALNKQVAYVGKVNFPADKESLGSIFVEIEVSDLDNIMKIINYLAPETVDGHIVQEEIPLSL